MSTTPIADYALLSDRHSAALVSRDGSIDWLCFPRFDSPSIFGRLLGDEAGHWSIRAMAATQVTRRYLDRTMALETTFRTPTGAVAITGAPGVRPAPGVWAGPSPVRCCRWWSGRVWGRRRAGPLCSCGPDRRGVGGLRPAPPPPRRERGLRPSPRQARRDGLSQGLEPIRDRRAVRRHRVGVGVVVGAPPRPTWVRGETWYTTADGCSRHSPSHPQARSAQRRPPRYLRRWAAPETGITATPGSGTPPSRSRPFGWRPALTKPTSSSTT